MGFLRSVMFALGLTAVGMLGCEESRAPPAARHDAGIDARVDVGNNGRGDAARPQDTGYQHDAYDAGSDAAKKEDAYDATRPSDAYDATRMFDAHDAQQKVDVGLQNDARRIEDVLDAAREAGYDAQRADAHDAAYADAQSDAGNPPACPPGEQRVFYNGPDGTIGIGNCRAGLEACLRQEDDSFAYEIVREEVLPQPERCNQQDDNCNRQIDEGVQLPFYRDDDHDGHGTELDALQACQQPDGYVGRAGDCDDRNNQVNPDAPELCDQEQQDHNCDGAINEGCECLEAEVRSCGSDEGECETGLQICDFDGMYSPCVGARGPEPERCDGKDNSCDGQTDEGYDLGVECLVGVGACERSGVTVCAPEGDRTVCSAQAGESQQEKCDNSDADCDGVRNNGYNVGAACDNEGVGACRAEGVNVCAPNGLETICNAPQIAPQPEVCADGIDQDCTGEADDAVICRMLIAYICNPNGDKDVCVITLNGDNQKNLTEHPSLDWNDWYNIPIGIGHTIPVSWSSDGRGVVFVSNRGDGSNGHTQRVYSADVVTGDIVELFNAQAQIWNVSISPDGQKIAYIQGFNAAYHNFETGETRQINGEARYPRWNFSSTGFYHAGRSIYFTNIGNGVTQPITNQEGTMLALSPDETKILFTSGRTLYLKDLLTREERVEDQGAFGAEWAPDSTHYAFVNAAEPMDVYYRNLITREVQRLSGLNDLRSRNEMPAVSPDGNWAVFVSNRDGNKNLYKVEIATGIQTRLTNDPGDEEAPVFAPVQR